VEKDKLNPVTFPPLKAGGLRIEATFQQGASAGILEWRLTGPSARK
jgi:hypothetical protein